MRDRSQIVLDTGARWWQAWRMARPSDSAPTRYDAAAPRWGDKMRALGYYDAYLGFLSARPGRAPAGLRLVDVGAGTAAFSEAWIAINGPPRRTTLLEPSRAMLERGRDALRRRGVEPLAVHAALGQVPIDPAEVVLAAHVIEHCDDPLAALKQIRALLVPGGTLHLVVSKPHWCNALIWLQWRHRTFRKNEITGLVEAAGLAIDGLYAFPSGPPSRTSLGLVATRPGRTAPHHGAATDP